MMINQPNILLFFPDALQAACVAPDRECDVPNLDKLMKQGVSFENAHTVCPICSPARASLMTGLLPHNHGVVFLEHTVDEDQCNLREEYPHWAQALRDSGYRTGYFGKWHIERSEELDRFGWAEHRSWRHPEFIAKKEEWLQQAYKTLIPSLTYHQKSPEGYTDYLYCGVTEQPVDQLPISLPVDFALPFLDDVVDGEEPWCCCVSFSEPNEELLCSRESFSRYDPDKLPLPGNFSDESDTRPRIYERAKKSFEDMTERDWKLARACYLARVTEIDAQLGRLLERIENSTSNRQTIVVITTDHGRHLGAHGLDGHNYGAYEEIYNIPMIVSGPGISQGLVSQRLVGNHDLCPTVLELAGLPPFGESDAVSFANELKNPCQNSNGRGTGYAEYHGTRYTLTQRVLWRDNWKYVFNGFDFDELYDLDHDPLEMDNLINVPEHQQTADSLLMEIRKKLNETADKPLCEAQYYSLRFPPVGPAV